ncbi:MAG: hypothetical protein KGI68_01000 [Alphaproteobacteria bacterium]|nr:hypothetical protein [Alphaproteobacteria bacterium]MDE2264987.1 hypothetical protein [Alphaproteobacteria bacterium]MDE2500773.1 hypothetical protein [Alphaproteobacteria bacterium]
MRRVFLSLLLFAVVASQAAVAAPTADGAPGTNVEMPFLIAPMSQDGRLLGYSYISSKLVASSQSAAIAIRDKLAFIQDAFVRDVNARPIGQSNDPRTVDRVLLNSRLVADAGRIVGAEKVVNMVFVDIKFAPLHPGDTTLDMVPPSDRAPDLPQKATPTLPLPANGTAATAAAGSPAATSNPPAGSNH